MQNLASAQGVSINVANSPEEITPLLKGAKIPNSSLTKVDGTTATLVDILNNQPAVLIFYRGSWCGFCTAQLVELNKITKELKELGFNLFAISPDTPTGAKELIVDKNLNFTLFSDSTLSTSGDFGLAFHVDDATVETYLNKYKVDLEKASGQTHHNLPVPAVYIIGADGTINFAYSNPDPAVRLSNKEIMKAVKAIVK